MSCHSCESRNPAQEDWIPGQARNDSNRHSLFPIMSSDVGMSVKSCPLKETDAGIKQAEEEIMRLLREVTE